MKNSTKLLWTVAGGILAVIFILSVSVRMMTTVNGRDKPNIFFNAHTYKNIVGNGKIKTESAAVKQYDAANINGEFDVTIQSGKGSTASITTDENILPFIVTTSSNNQLMIGLQQGISVTPSKPQRLLLTTEKLHDIKLNGKNVLHTVNILSEQLNLTMHGNNQGDLQGNIKKLQISLTGKSNLHVKLEHSDNIDLTMSGNGIVYLSGAVKHLNIVVTGRARVDAKELIADSVILQGAGESEMIVHAVKKLSVLIAGKSNIKYYGNPVLSKHYFGQTSVEQIQE